MTGQQYAKRKQSFFETLLHLKKKFKGMVSDWLEIKHACIIGSITITKKLK